MYTYKTQKEVREAFWIEHPQFQNDYRKTWRQNKYPCNIRITFVDFVDYLQRSEQISKKLAYRVTL